MPPRWMRSAGRNNGLVPRMKQKRRKKRKGSNRGVTSICFIVLILLVILSVQSQGLKEKLKVYAAQQEELQQKVS